MMGNWKHGGIFGFDKSSKDVSFCTDKRGVVHALTRNSTELRHYMRGSQNPFPWESKGRVIPGSFVGSGHISVFRDGNLQLIWPRSDGDNDHWWVNPLDFDDPSGDPEPPIKPKPDKKLSVEGGQILYGEPIVLIGASCRPALLKGTGEWDDWTNGYSLEKYERDIIASGINYVRHLGILDSSPLYEHCKRMKDAGIIVEVEVYDPELSPSPLVEIDRMGELALLGNVLFDVGNEFKSHESAIDVVIDLCKRLKAQGCIVGTGAWSGEEGQGYSETFHDRYDGHDYETHHRHWVPSHWKRTLEYGKPVLWNEFFNLGGYTLGDIEALMKQAIQTGVHVQFYHFFGPPETQTFKEVLNIAGRLV